MPVPKGYKRGSGGFLQPIGRTVKSGGVGPSRSQIETQSKAKYDVIMDRISKGYEKRQKDHEAIMAGYAKVENDKFDRIQKALEAERKNAPKDKLGNPVETDLARYLADQLKGLLVNKSLKGKKLTPPEAGIPAKQIGPAGTLITPTPQEAQMDATAEQERGGGEPGTAPAAKVDYSQPPSVGERVEVLRGEGDTVQVTVLAPPDIHGMVKIRLQDGTVGVVPAKEINRINLEDPIPGVPPPDPSGHRRRYFENEQRQAILRDIQGGL
jgi:hypothetical protein